MAHGIAGGVMSTLNGGEFGHGFWSAGITQALAGPIDRIPERPLRIMAAATVGGTTSQITGGKFANGAVTGAFSRAFNDEQSHGRRRNDSSFSEGKSTRSFYSVIDGTERINWFGLAEEDWRSTGLDVIAARFRLKGLVPDLQYAREFGVYEQQFSRYEAPVQWWVDEYGEFHQMDIGPSVAVETEWRPPDQLNPVIYSRLRWRVCYWSSCAGGE